MKNLWSKFIILLLALLGIAAYQLTASSLPDHKFHMYVLDIGQGDAILLRSPDGYWALIDGGRGAQILPELGEVLPFAQRDLDFVIVTHPDADHIGGLVDVVSNYRVNRFYANNFSKETNVYKELNSRVTSSMAVSQELRDNHDFQWGCCIQIDILWPKAGDSIFSKEDTNEYSVTLLIKYNELEIFAGGDLGSSIEDQLIESIGDIDVLKVSHHGSATSTSAKFLQAIKPEVSIIPVGAGNSYGHPHPQILANLQQANSKVFRTDTDGRIELVSDGYSVEVTSEKTLVKFELSL
jgi:competence protein ComEC